jgi:hypothetical protein
VDVAQLLRIEVEDLNLDAANTFEVEGGEVSVSFISAKQARLYSAPRSLVGKILAIYFKPAQPVFLADLKLPRSFRKCVEQLSRMHYYYVGDGLAYQFRSGGEQVEWIIYQPMRAEIRRLNVSTDCVF